MAELKREEGYYWVKFSQNFQNGGDWCIAYWYSCGWAYDGNSYSSSDTVEINETRIRNPDEK